MANSVKPGSLLFASRLNSSVMLGNYLQQTTFSDAFFLGALRVKTAGIENIRYIALNFENVLVLVIFTSL